MPLKVIKKILIYRSWITPNLFSVPISNFSAQIFLSNRSMTKSFPQHLPLSFAVVNPVGDYFRYPACHFMRIISLKFL